MSSLQAIADVIKKVINSLTSNCFFAVAIGIVVTMIIQSHRSLPLWWLVCKCIDEFDSGAWGYIWF